ncbi:MAG: Nre family DNA repair protein [Candidatus Bathyarchaeia archaeon]
MPATALKASGGKEKLSLLDSSSLGFDPASLLDLSLLPSTISADWESLRLRVPQNGLCVLCKGSRMLCRKAQCPIIARLSSHFAVAPKIRSLRLEGSSPPGVFVGRIGYPHVSVGPLAPPFQGDTSLLDLPELWFGRSIQEIAAFRSSLVRGKTIAHVQDAEAGGRLLEMTRELALAADPIEVELRFEKEPRGYLLLSDDVQPFGPSARISDMRTGGGRWDARVEKAYEDTDLKAAEAVLNLFHDGVLVSRIQRALSIGALGLKGQRRLVPTRWSITAVDDTISRALAERVKEYPIIDEYRVYESEYLDNRFEVLMMPQAWSYEAIEAWYPNTLWNPSSPSVVFYGDHEGFNGRATYASMGGCYYASRLAVTEYLVKERRQASVLVLREAHPGYIMPVGVWQVRENTRNALRNRPLRFNTLREALARIAARLEIPLETWIRGSRLLRDALHQRTIADFLSQPSPKG